MPVNSINVKHNNSVNSAFSYKHLIQGGSNPYYKIKPQTALNWDFNTTYKALENLIGSRQVQEIFNGKQVAAPHSKEKNSEWLKQSKIVGINPRAIGTYLDVIKYAMTFPEDSVHMLPLFEQGCQGSLYSPINFKLTKEFMDDELTKQGFDTPEKQLKLTVNLLHALNKNVGMDFLQHTDRFSEEVFVNPDNFNWAKLDSTKSKELRYPDTDIDKIGSEVKSSIVDFLRENGDSKGKKIPEITLKNLYSLKEEKIRELLFGNDDIDSRNQRRVELMNHVRSCGFETRPISIDDPKRKIVFKEMNGSGNSTWATFTDNIDDHLFGNLTGYKLYHFDKYGNIDISRPNESAWNFICKKNAEFQKKYNFDFLRADMGYLHYNDEKADIHSKVKQYIQEQTPYFASLGESFGSYRNPENEAIKRKAYDAILGNLHYEHVYNPDYNDIVKDYNFASDYKLCVTTFTADADKRSYNHCFDDFQNKIRTFYGLFLNQPSYMGMGLETRDVNPTESKKLTKDFINDWGNGKYEWGQNDYFYNIISGMRNVFAKIKDEIQNQFHYWVHTSDKRVASWFYYDKETSMPSYIFVSNADTNAKNEVEIQNLFDTTPGKVVGKERDSLVANQIYSTEETNPNEGQIIVKGKKYKIRNLKPGECRIYKIVNSDAIDKMRKCN